MGCLVLSANQAVVTLSSPFLKEDRGGTSQNALHAYFNGENLVEIYEKLFSPQL